MASIKDIAVSKRDVYMIAPSEIHEKDGWNVRDETPEYIEHIDNLAISIAEIGVKEPLKCYFEGDILYVSNGHSRLRAVKQAEETFGIEIKAVPVLLEERTSNDADRCLTLLTSNSGKPLTILERAKVYKRLLGFSWSVKEIAQKSGVSIKIVNQAIELCAMPEIAHNLVREGKASASLALEAVKNGELDKLTEAAKNADGKVTRQKLDGQKRAAYGYKSTVKAIIEAVFDTVEYNEDATAVTMTLTSDQWREMLRLLKL